MGLGLWYGKVKGYATNNLWNIAQIKLISLFMMFDLPCQLSGIGMKSLSVNG